MKKNIVLTGGGTMGHISPNLALIPTLTKNYTEIHYIGSKNSLEQTRIEELKPLYPNLYFHAIASTKLNRTNWLKNFSIPFILIKAKKQAKNCNRTCKNCRLVI